MCLQESCPADEPDQRVFVFLHNYYRSCGLNGSGSHRPSEVGDDVQVERRLLFAARRQGAGRCRVRRRWRRQVPGRVGRKSPAGARVVNARPYSAGQLRFVSPPPRPSTTISHALGDNHRIAAGIRAAAVRTGNWRESGERKSRAGSYR